MSDTITIPRPPKKLLRPGESGNFKKSKALEILDTLARSFRFDDLDDAAREGKTVVWSLAPGWDPLFKATDAHSGMLRRWIRDSHKAATIAEDYFRVPPETCTVMKVSLGAHRMRSLRPNGEPIKRILHFGGDCEYEVIAQELMRREGYDVHFIEGLSAFGMLEERKHEYVHFYAEQARSAALWLTGKPVDEDRLREEIKKQNIINRKIREIIALRVHNPLYLPLVRLNQIMMSSNHFYAAVDHEKNRAQYLLMLDTLIEELKELQDQPVPFHVPLAFVGIMYSLDLYRAIDLTHGAVVTGMEPILYNEDVPPLEALGEYLLEMQLRGEMHDKSGSVVSYRRYRVEKQIELSGAKGLIVGGTSNCPYLAIARELEYEYFTKKGIPVLVLDGSAHDEPATEEQKMRLRAYIEMFF